MIFPGTFLRRKTGGGEACKLGRVGKKRLFPKKTHTFGLSFHEIMRL